MGSIALQRAIYFFLHSCIILESFLSVREFYFRECFVNKVVRVASRSKA